MTHTIYIDDSGTKEYAVSPDLYETTGKSRYFVFGGVLISNIEASKLAQKIKDEKLNCFGVSNVEIKSTWLRIPDQKERRYLNPYSITDEMLTEFVKKYYSIIANADLQLIAAVVDKVHTQEDYPEPWYAPTIAYELLMQRVVQAFSVSNCVRVAIDDMTGKTPKRNDYKINLQRHHEKLRQHGSSLQKGINFGPLSPNIKFVNSANSHLIQVADVISYNVYRQFKEHGDAWETTGQRLLPSYEWFSRIGRKFRQGPNQRIQGYGIVKFPMRKRVAWKLKREG